MVLVVGSALRELAEGKAGGSEAGESGKATRGRPVGGGIAHACKCGKCAGGATWG